LFGGEVRPAHFTDYRHCDACAQHDAGLLNSSPATPTLDDVRPNPLYFITPDGLRYCFPALLRLAIVGTGPTCICRSIDFSP